MSLRKSLQGKPWELRSCLSVKPDFSAINIPIEQKKLTTGEGVDKVVVGWISLRIHHCRLGNRWMRKLIHPTAVFIELLHDREWCIGVTRRVSEAIQHTTNSLTRRVAPKELSNWHLRQPPRQRNHGS